MDNLLAEGKTKPFIIAMEFGGNPFAAGARRPTNAPPASASASGTNNAAGPERRPAFNFNFSAFEHALIDDFIPYIDSTFRTIADQPHRAMAGLSLVGGDYSSPDTFMALAQALDDVHSSCAVFYLAIPPTAFPSICESLAAVGL